MKTGLPQGVGWGAPATAIASEGVHREHTAQPLREGARRYEVEGGLGFLLDPKRPLGYQKLPVS